MGRIDEVAEVEGILLGVAVEAELGSYIAVEIVVLEEVAGAEHVAAGDGVGVDLFDDGGEVGGGVLDAVVDGLLDFWREPIEVEGLVGADVEFREAGKEGGLGGVGRAKLEDEVDVGEGGPRPVGRSR